MFKYYFRLKYINDQCDGPHDLLRGAFNEDKYLCPENSVSWSNSLKYNCLKQWDFNPWKSSLSFSLNKNSESIAHSNTIVPYRLQKSEGPKILEVSPCSD